MKYDEKLSELLGILKSINYDEIINDLEINSLKSWINANENSDNACFKEIILKLKKILLKKTISKDDKKEIINITDYYYNLDIKIYGLNELLGIIKGIVSDNKINYKEVEKLNIWIEKNYHLTGTYFYDEVKKISIYLNEKKIFEENEINKLNYLLSFILKDNNLNQRIFLLKRDVKNKKLIGNQLIELINDNVIITKIHNEAINQLDKLIEKRCSVYEIDSEIIFISLTLIALLEYDGNYYEYVQKVYEQLYNKYNEQKIEGQIRNVISNYKTDDNEYRIISQVLKNSLVPKKFLPSFFDFIFDIYKLNFNYNIDGIDLNDEFSFVYDGIKRVLDKDNDELNLKITNKTYTLIKTTKDLIFDDNMVIELIKLSSKILEIIDKYYWNDPDKEYENEYFKYGFENWKNKCPKNDKKEIKATDVLKSRWEPKFKIENNRIYLQIPNHKVKSLYDYEKLKILISNEKKIIFEKKLLNVYNIIGGYKIEIDDIEIVDPLGKLNYKLLCNEEIIYDSKDKLYRDYILFNDSGIELKNNQDYSGLVYICCKEKINNSSELLNNDKYIISTMIVKQNDYIKIGNELFNFSTILSPGIIGKNIIGKYIDLKVEHLIYSELEGIAYESELEIEQIALVINGKRNKLTSFCVDIKKRNNYYNYFIKLNLENNKYKILIEEYNENKSTIKKTFEFILDKEFSYNILPVNKYEYLIDIKCLNKKYQKYITKRNDNINKIELDDINFILPLDLPLFKIDNEEWRALEDYIWVDDLGPYSNLRINGLKFNKVYICDEKDNKLSTLYPSEKEYYLDLPIGTLKSYNTHKYIILEFYTDDKKTGNIYCYCQCVLNEKLTKFWYDETENKYKGQIEYYGKGNIYINIYDFNEICILTKKINHKEIFELEKLKPFIEYKLELINKKIGFNLQKDKDSIIYKNIIKYYSINNFVGRYFQIYTVDFDQTVKNIWMRKTIKLYSTYLEITDRISKYEFKGNIYIYKNSKKYFSNINPVEIEFTSNINDGKIEAAITKDGDGLLIDFDNHTILDDLSSKFAVDIFSYLINVERSKKLCQD